MARPELGTKRLCAGCSAKFYDMNKTPIVCPTCEAVFDLPKPPPARGGRPFEPVVVTMPVAIAPVSEAVATLEKPDGDEKEDDGGIPLLETNDD